MSNTINIWQMLFVTWRSPKFPVYFFLHVLLLCPLLSYSISQKLTGCVVTVLGARYQWKVPDVFHSVINPQDMSGLQDWCLSQLAVCGCNTDRVRGSFPTNTSIQYTVRYFSQQRGSERATDREKERERAAQHLVIPFVHFHRLFRNFKFILTIWPSFFWCTIGVPYIYENFFLPNYTDH